MYFSVYFAFVLEAAPFDSRTPRPLWYRSRRLSCKLVSNIVVAEQRVAGPQLNGCHVGLGPYGLVAARSRDAFLVAANWSSIGSVRLLQHLRRLS